MGKKAFAGRGGAGGTTYKAPPIANYRKQLGKNEVHKERTSSRDKRRFQSTGDVISSGMKNWKVVVFILLILGVLFVLYFTFALETSLFFSS